MTQHPTIDVEITLFQGQEVLVTSGLPEDPDLERVTAAVRELRAAGHPIGAVAASFAPVPQIDAQLPGVQPLQHGVVDGLETVDICASLQYSREHQHSVESHKALGFELLAESNQLVGDETWIVRRVVRNPSSEE